MTSLTPHLRKPLVEETLPALARRNNEEDNRSLVKAVQHMLTLFADIGVVYATAPQIESITSLAVQEEGSQDCVVRFSSGEKKVNLFIETVNGSRETTVLLSEEGQLTVNPDSVLALAPPDTPMCLLVRSAIANVKRVARRYHRSSLVIHQLQAFLPPSVKEGGL